MRAIRGALVAESALLAAGAVAVIVDLIVRGDFSGRQVGMAAFLVACALGIAWALLAAGRALGAGRRSGRAVVMTWQLFQGILGATALATASVLSVVLGAVLLVLAVGVAFLLLTPRVVEATTRH
ncbi:sodium:galactoside symporter family protein [Xylanimonas cellulosilytica DSM 15894]|uniref:Sodium:galactoside symporter family protein n=1 Tax=Xylanimonas cellulosilytica (strain DSM 15894 / JCM 12276 / CECT 5975 / KCTC 9989 / LMG 20990 / NBRC 107835 / XIL07) TaxID=446471 RepID=D1BX53_XYLCX|nr:hypothetical protein [Xylanimonas cellulosilytica]ACZ31621.1 sodium:galactoside symporter family protein [Xylanimonas cellulosilytica DSM 15894]